MGKRKGTTVDWRESDPGICETFGRLDALYHAATGRRLKRSRCSLEIVQGLVCGYGMDAVEWMWAWWMREPEYGRDCGDPLAYFADDSTFDDIHVLAIADEARSRLLARSRKIQRPEASDTHRAAPEAVITDARASLGGAEGASNGAGGG
jgi:hypothetical protein